MALYVVSDLHLGESSLVSMFRDEDQGRRLAELCAHVAAEPDSELVLLGDILDVTAACPPRKGLTQFGVLLDVPIEDKPPPPLPAILRGIRDAGTASFIARAASTARIRIHELVREQSGNNSACGQTIDLLVFIRTSQGGRGSVVE